MKDFTVEELIKIVLFYKNKASDLELAYLELQISNVKELQKQKEISDAELISHRKALLEQNQKDVLNFTKEIGKLNSELKKYKAKKTTGK
jgi:mevalonate kinase